VDKVDCKIGECMSSVQGKLDSSNTVVNELRNTCKSTVNANSDRVNGISASRSRELNIVLFGINEERDRTVWYNAVSELCCGRKVDVRDALRLGAFNSNKTRPVLVSLCNPWDKKLILSNCRKLATSDELPLRRVYIVANEAVEERRMKVLVL